jgi:hypothetical protein
MIKEETREHVNGEHVQIVNVSNVRVYVDGLFSRLVDVYGVGMSSRTVLGLVEMYFVFRVLI